MDGTQNNKLDTLEADVVGSEIKSDQVVLKEIGDILTTEK